MTNRRWSVIFIVFVCIELLILGLPTIIIDPFFHYHAPLEQLEYPLNNQRYQNDGIMRHFEYNALITGTSMTENFKTSEFDRLFDVISVKVPFSGASYKEINDNIKSAVERNSKLTCVVRGLDYDGLLEDKDRMKYELYPVYLYNDFWPDDVSYVFNKEILCDNTFGVIQYTRAGQVTPNFDEYSRWEYPVGREAVLSSYERPEVTTEKCSLSKEDYEKIAGNVSQNIVLLALQNPQIDFYLFWTPYSIVYWDSLKQRGELEKQLQIEKFAAELLMGYSNIHLFSFYDDFDLICNLDNYKDWGHYAEHVNSLILKNIYEGRHELTEENYGLYYEKVYDFYTCYNYDDLFRQ